MSIAQKFPAVFTEQPEIYQIARKFIRCQTGDAGSGFAKAGAGVYNKGIAAGAP